MLSGCLPAMIYYGLDMLSSKNFLPSIFFLTSLVSFCTGSSWTTIATVGVIGMGIGSVLGIPPAHCAGACISGALAGDKICPISEGTNMAAASTGANLYTHIRTALPTHAIAWIIALAMYLVVGLGIESTATRMEQAEELQLHISSLFNVSPVFILPIVIILGASILQMPTIPTVAVGIVITIPFAMAQGFGIVEILCAISDGVALEISDPMLAEIVNRGGISSMFGTMSIVITALAFGGVMQGAGIFDVLTTAIFSKIKSQRLYPAVGVGVSTMDGLGHG